MWSNSWIIVIKFWKAGFSPGRDGSSSRNSRQDIRNPEDVILE